LAGMYLYQADAALRARDQDQITLNGLAALSPSRVLVLERNTGETTTHLIVHDVDLSLATNLVGRTSGRIPGLEAKSDLELARLEWASLEVVPAAKRPVADLTELGLANFKAEGLAVVDATTIALVNDNDFGVSGFTAGQGVSNGIETRLVLISLSQPLWKAGP